MVKALPCKLCGGHLTTLYYDAFSCDSSFEYVGCSDCDVSFVNQEEITPDVIERWNKLMEKTDG